MDIQDLVVSQLPEQPEKTPKENLSPLEAFNEGYGVFYEETAQLAAELPGQLQKSPEEAPYLIARLFAYLQNTKPGAVSKHVAGATPIFVHAVTYAQDKSQESFDYLCQWSEEICQSFRKDEEVRRYSAVIGTSELQIQFLQEIFEDKLLEEIIYITGVKRASAKRWLQGGNISWRNSFKIENLAKLFYSLESIQGMNRQEALDWYRAPFRKGKSPQERLSLHNPYADELKEVMSAVTESEGRPGFVLLAL